MAPMGRGSKTGSPAYIRRSSLYDHASPIAAADASTLFDSPAPTPYRLQQRRGGAMVTVRVFVCICVGEIAQKAVERFGPNFQGREIMGRRFNNG